MSKLAYIGLIFLLLFVSCSDDTVAPEKPKSTNIIQPFRVGNYWKYEVIDAWNGRTVQHHQIVSQKIMYYDSSAVSLFRFDIESEDASGVSYMFVYDGFVYQAEEFSEMEIEKATPNFPYRYTGQEEVEYMGKKLTVTQETREFQHEEIDVIKMAAEDNSIVMYIKL